MVLGVLDQFIIGLGGDLGFICNFLKTNFGTPNRLLAMEGKLLRNLGQSSRTGDSSQYNMCH